MNLHDNIIKLPYELQEEIHKFVYPTPIDFKKFKKVYDNITSNKDYTPYFMNKFKNISIDIHWNNYKENPMNYPEIQIQNFYNNHDLFKIIDYCIDTRFPTSILELLEQHLNFNHVFIKRINSLYDKHFYRDYDKIPGIGKIYFWNDELVDEEIFYEDIIDIINDVENLKTNNSVIALYNIYKMMLYIYYRYDNE